MIKTMAKWVIPHKKKITKLEMIEGENIMG